MTQWLLIDQQHYSENTPEYGHGDFPERIDFIRMVVEADTIRKAQNAVKKRAPRIRFGGMFSPLLIRTDDRYASLHTKPADLRLGPNARASHEASLLTLEAIQ